MKVEKEIFYHVPRQGPYAKYWVPKASFTFDKKQYNSFFNERLSSLELSKITCNSVLVFEDLKDKLNNEYAQLIDQINSYEKLQLNNARSDSKAGIVQYIESNIVYFSQSKQYLEQLDNVFGELVFESVRQESYSHLPSRLNCIWLCEEDSIIHWKEIIGSDKVFKVRLNGIIHKADGKYIAPQNFNKPQYEEFARKYWSGDSVNNEIEYLFEGNLEVLEEVKDYD